MPEKESRDDCYSSLGSGDNRQLPGPIGALDRIQGINDPSTPTASYKARTWRLTAWGWMWTLVIVLE